ncbi:hypothetical protein [Microvirga aerophila]|nr:hypothetical protein [Microvirga aerophila]
MAQQEREYEAEVRVESQSRWIKTTVRARTQYDAKGLFEAQYGKDKIRNMRELPRR